MRIIAFNSVYRGGFVRIGCSTGEGIESDNIGVLLDYLMQSYSPNVTEGGNEWPPEYDRVLRVAWDVDDFTAPIVRLLGHDKCLKLLNSKRCYLAPYRIRYYPEKLFLIEHISSKAKARFFNLSQYYPELADPVDLDDIVILGNRLLYELKKMDIEPKKLTSPVSIIEEEELDNLDLPTYLDCPKEVNTFSYQAIDSWIETHAVGLATEAWDFDLSTAYGTEAGELVDFRKGEWVRSDKYQRDAIMGFARCTIHLPPEVFVSPILYKNDEGMLESRTGTFERYCTKEQLRFIKRWQIGEVKIHDAWWFFKPKNVKGELPKPLKQTVNKLLDYKYKRGKYRQGTKMQQALAKRFLMFSGKLTEKHESSPDDPFGRHFCPPWKAIINENVSLKVAEFLYGNGIGPGNNEGYKHLLHISTDGVLLDKPVKQIPEQWRITYQGPALCLSSGNIFYAAKHPQGLTFDDIMTMIKEHPNQGYYRREVKRRVTLPEAMALDKFDDIGKTRTKVVTVDLLTMQHDRHFPRLPRTGRALLKQKYPSRPKSIDEG